jgi:hypothetical protein
MKGTYMKEKLKKIVQNYCILFADELRLFKMQTNHKISRDTGELKYTDMVRRPLYEIPENLDKMIKKGLNDEEKEYLKSIEGGRWFAKTFKEFSLITKI